MKRFNCIILLMLSPLIAFAQAAPVAVAAPAAPKKNTITTHRVWVKSGHEAAFKAALAAHAQKYHTGSWKWRVSDVVSGPDSGSFQIVEGPNSWTDLESRGDLGAEHSKDYQNNVQPHIEKSGPRSYMTYQESASTTGAANWSTKSAITHFYFKPGRGPATLEVIKSYKKSWEKQGINIVVWAPYSSGEPQYTIVRRFKNGFKDLDDNGPSMRQAFEDANGAGSFDKVQDEINRCVDHTVSEMIEFNGELSSK
jgi:hypothetical protein